LKFLKGLSHPALKEEGGEILVVHTLFELKNLYQHEFLLPVKEEYPDLSGGGGL